VLLLLLPLPVLVLVLGVGVWVMPPLLRLPAPAALSRRAGGRLGRAANSGRRVMLVVRSSRHAGGSPSLRRLAA
jgi:hypothetical protein